MKWNSFLARNKTISAILKIALTKNERLKFQFVSRKNFDYAVFWLVLSNSMKVFVNWALCQMNVGFYESKGSNGNYNHNMPQHLLKEEFVDLQNLLKKIYLLPTVKKKRVNFFFFGGGAGGEGGFIKARMEIAPKPLLQTKKKKEKKITFLAN